MLKPGMTITEFRKGLDKKDFTAVEGVRFFLDQITAKDGEIKAYLEAWGDTAMKEAEQIDEIIATGRDLGPLAGVPIAVKDNILIEGKESTGGSKILKGYRAEYEATVITKLKQAGAVLLGRTNMDEFAFGSSTEQSAWQVTHNPHDLERVPGGTSGGSAAAVAGNMTVAALGSDTGGSIRQPASFCGVVGLRPTYGAVSRYGLMAAASSFDQIGPLTKTVEDTAIIFKVIAGKDRFDSTSLDDREWGDRLLKPNKEKIESLKIGIPKEWWDEKSDSFKGTDKRTTEEIREAMTRFKKEGFKFEEISLPNAEYALASYYVSIFAEESSNLSRFDTLRYGASEATKTLSDFYIENRGRGFGDEVKRRLILGTCVLSSGFYDAYYGKAQKVREIIREDVNKALEKVDVLFIPTAPTIAFKIGEKTDDPLAMYYGDLYTVLASLTGHPALTVPVRKHGQKQNGLPVGFQLIGQRLGEVDILGLGRLYEKITK